MPERARIIDIERSLGFKWPGGLSKQNRWLLPSNLRNLLEDIDHLKVQSVGHSNKRFYASKAFVERSEHLFSVHGPKIWPIDVNERSQWLSWAPSDNNDGLYPENLYHYNETHREKLQQLFHDLCSAKCISYRNNQRQGKERKQGLGLESNSETEFQLDEGSRHGCDHPENEQTTAQKRLGQLGRTAHAGLALCKDTQFIPLVDVKTEDEGDTIVVTNTGACDDELPSTAAGEEPTTSTSAARGDERDSANLITACNIEESPSKRTGEKRARSQSPELNCHKTTKLCTKDGETSRALTSTSTGPPRDPNISPEAAVATRTAESSMEVARPHITTPQQPQLEHSSAGSTLENIRIPQAASGDGINAKSQKVAHVTAIGINSGCPVGKNCSNQRIHATTSYSHVENAVGNSSPALGNVVKSNVTERNPTEQSPVVGHSAGVHGLMDSVASPPRPITLGSSPARETCPPQQGRETSLAPCQGTHRTGTARCDSTSALGTKSTSKDASTCTPPWLWRGRHSVKVPTVVDLTMFRANLLEAGAESITRPSDINTSTGGSNASGPNGSSTYRAVEGDSNGNPRMEPLAVEATNTEQLENEVKFNTERQVETKETKHLSIDLVITDDPNNCQFISVTPETHVADLFKQVRDRMRRRLKGQDVQGLALKLPQHPTETRAFIVDDKDPHTWKKFLSRAKEIEGYEVDVNGVVDLERTAGEVLELHGGDGGL